MFTENNLIKTKYLLPGVSPYLLSRKRLSQKLDEAFRHRVTIVSAPAGYGKTTAALDWIENRGITAAWFSIDQNDDNPEIFWRYCIAALSRAYPQVDFGEISTGRESVSSNIAAGLLIDKLYGISGDAFLILDDFHLIKNEVILQPLAFFFKNVPVHFHTILLSRENLDTEFEELYFKDQVWKVNADDLSFTIDEIARFFELRNCRISAEGLKRIESETEGWAAGLVVASLAFREQKGFSDADLLLPSAGLHIKRFINEQIFSGWTDEIRTFLLKTSVLDRFSVPLCAAVTGFSNCGELIENLLEYNSFIAPLDNRREWFRYHHLFSRFLKDRLTQNDPSAAPKLLVKAAVWYERNGLATEAMDAYIAGNDYEKAYTLFRKIYQHVCNGGGYALLFRWMQRIPPEVHRYDVIFCIEFAWFLMIENRTAEAETWTTKAEASFDQTKSRMKDAEQRNYLEILICLARANIATLRLNAEEAARYYVRACRIPMQTSVFIGELNPDQPSTLKTYWGFFGRFGCVKKAFLPSSKDFFGILGNFAAYVSLLFIESLYEQNRLKECNELLTENFEQILDLGTSGAIVPCFLTLAKIKMAKGDWKSAIEAVDACRMKLLTENRAHWNYLLDLFTASLYIGMGDRSGAAEWLDLGRVGSYDTLTAANEYEHLVFARFLILTNKTEEAVLLLGRLKVFTEKERRLGSHIEALCLMAIAYEQKYDRTRAMETLDEALMLGMKEGYARTFLDETEPMARLLRKYRRWRSSQSKEKREYVNNLLRYIKPPVEIQTGVPGKMACNLTRTEKKVLTLLVAGRNNFEISEALGMNVRTVKFHNTNIFSKMGVKNRTEAANRAKETGILD